MAKCRLFRKSQNSRHYRQQRHSLAVRRIPVALHSFHPAGLVYLRARDDQGRGERRRLALLARSAYLERIELPGDDHLAVAVAEKT